MKTTNNLKIYSKEINEENYEECKKIIYHCIHKYIRRYGGDFQELHQEICLFFFTKIIKSYDPDKHTKFKTWLYSKIEFFLLENSRKEMIKKNRKRQQVYSPLEKLESREESKIERISKEVSKDARDILKIVIHKPKAIKKRVNRLKDNYPNSWRKALINLLSEIGWSMSRTLEAFKEIKEAL